MGIFQQFPYTNFHEMNLDWLLSKMKELGDDFIKLADEFKNFVAETEPTIRDEVDAWLDEHPEATTTVQDGSLTEPKFSNALKLKAIKDYVTPEMFGAVGDGVTDDTQAIQDMLESGEKLFLLSKKYLIGSNVGDATVYSLSDFENVQLIGKGTLIDARTPVANQSAYAIFEFHNSNNITVDLKYQGQAFEVGIDSLKTTGYTFIALYSCENVDIHVSTKYCRQAVQVEIYQGTGTSRNIKIVGNIEDTGYLASLYNCEHFSIKGSGIDYHRICFMAGCTDGNVDVSGKTDYSMASPVLMTDSNNKGCTDIIISIIDDGSQFTGEVGLVGISTQDTNNLDYSFDANIEISDTSTAIGAIFTGMNGNLINSKINILDKKASSSYMTINTARITGNVKGLILSVNANTDINIGSDCLLIDSVVRSLNLVTSKNITIINSKATNVYVSGDGSGSCSVINSQLKIPANSFVRQFVDIQWLIGSTRPTLTSTDFCIMYDTSVNKLIVHQGNYWYELASRGNAV